MKIAKSHALLLAGLLAILVGVSIAAAEPARISASRGDESSVFRSLNVRFHEDAGVRNERILSVGGLLARASCTDFGRGRKYLSVTVKTRINDASRATILSQKRGGQVSTYLLKSSDFDRSFGWYDLLGTNPYRTTGTFSYARPDGGQVALTFRADETTSGNDCVFDGMATYLLAN